jgi:glutamate racemase
VGDIARSPYGTKSKEAVTRFSIEIGEFLLHQGAEVIVVACNTASSVALDALRAKFSVPILGVIEPGAKTAAEVTRNNKIGVIGTTTTISSESYRSAIKPYNPDAKIFSKPCPLLVPLVEEGWIDNPITKLVVKEYLQPMKELEIDTLILGCTHYPLIRGIIQEVMGDGVVLVDSAHGVALEVKSYVREKKLKRGKRHKFYTTDRVEQFTKIGELFLGEKIEEVIKIEL